MVSEGLWGQLRAGLSVGPVQSGGLVAAESGARSVRAAAADSRACPRPAPLRLSPDLGAAAPRRLADQSQARALADGPPFRVLTVVDQWDRQTPVLEVASSMSRVTVRAALDRVLRGSTGRRSITVDHRTEFQSRALEDWAYPAGQTCRKRAH